MKNQKQTNFFLKSNLNKLLINKDFIIHRNITIFINIDKDILINCYYKNFNSFI